MENKNSRRRMMLAGAALSTSDPAISQSACGGLTAGPNVAHDGKYPQLQTLAPGGTCRESFWVRTSGI